MSGITNKSVFSSDEVLIRSAKKRVFHSLDALRGVAAVAVVLLHYRAFVSPISFGSAQLAVDIFFLMSGLVIANAYEEKLSKSLSVKNFIIARLVRLYPLYILGTLIGVSVPTVGLLLHISSVWTWGQLLVAVPPALLMLPSATVPGMPSSLYAFNYPAWSLLFEILVNLLYALMMRSARKISLTIVIAIAAAALILGSLNFGTVDKGAAWSYWWMGGLRVLFSFYLGVALYRLYRDGRLPNVRVPPLLSLTLVALLLYWHPQAEYAVVYQLLCVMVFFPGLVALCILSEPRRGIRAMTALGLISYPLYVIHVPVLIGSVSIGRKLWGDPAGMAPWLGIAILVALLGTSWLLALTYDIRMRRWLLQLIEKTSNARFAEGSNP